MVELVLHLTHTRKKLEEVFKKESSNTKRHKVEISTYTIKRGDILHKYVSCEDYVDELKGCVFDSIVLHSPVSCDFLRSVIYPGIVK